MTDVLNKARTLYLDARQVQARVDGRAMRLSQRERSDVLVPLERVERMVVEAADDGLVAACLGVIERGGVVHFMNATGEPLAIMQASRPNPSAGPRRLATHIRARQSAFPLDWWRNAQWRHAWSLVFRRSPVGSLLSACGRFKDYLALSNAGPIGAEEWSRLEGKIIAWLQAEFDRTGLYPVLGAAAEYRVDISAILRDCLTLPTAWAYIKWRREQRGLITDLDITRFFELHALAHIPLQYKRHMTALAGEFSMTWAAVLTGESTLLWEDDDEP